MHENGSIGIIYHHNILKIDSKAISRATNKTAGIRKCIKGTGFETGKSAFTLTKYLLCENKSKEGGLKKK